jgi:hypothetical protein
MLRSPRAERFERKNNKENHNQALTISRYKLYFFYIYPLFRGEDAEVPAGELFF